MSRRSHPCYRYRLPNLHTNPPAQTHYCHRIQHLRSTDYLLKPLEGFNLEEAKGKYSEQGVFFSYKNPLTLFYAPIRTGASAVTTVLNLACERAVYRDKVLY